MSAKARVAKLDLSSTLRKIPVRSRRSNRTATSMTLVRLVLYGWAQTATKKVSRPAPSSANLEREMRMHIQSLMPSE